MNPASTGFNTVSAIDVSAISESSFNEAIGGKSLGVGTHAVTISSLEVKDYGNGPNIIVVLENDQGSSIKMFVPVKFQPKDTTKAPMFSSEYRTFGRLLIRDDDAAFRAKVFAQMIPANTALLDAARGAKMTITVAPGSRGCTIAPNDGGSFTIVDVKTGKAHVKAADKVFLTLKEAADYMTVAGLKRQFNEVVSMSVTPEELASNEKSLRAYLTAAENPTNVAALHRFSAF